MTTGQPLSRAVARSAAEWLALLHSGTASPAELAACRHWRSAAPEHELAWQRAERLAGMLGAVPGRTGVAILGRRERGRRHFAKTLLALLSAGPLSYTAWQAWDEDLIGSLAADQRTATGEQRRIVLADGGIVYLNTATAMDIAYTASRREIVLHAGEILVETAVDREVSPARPFIVRTAQGSLRALGTHFIVRSAGGNGRTHLAVLAGAVEVSPRYAATRPTVVQAGQQTQFTVDGSAGIETLEAHAGDWSRGLIVADNQRLADFAAELGRHRPGLLRCDQAVGELRITGAFQLNNIDAILAALPDTLPVKVVYRTRWWVSIMAPQG